MNSARITTEGRWVRIGLAFAIMLLLGFLAISRDSSRAPLPLFPCAFHAISGLPCLFCGGTRAARAILRGDLQAALSLNSLAFPALFLLALAVVALLFEAFAARPLAHWELVLGHANRFAPILILLAGGWWIAHICLALKAPKRELVDLRNPVAAKARELFERTGR